MEFRPGDVIIKIEETAYTLRLSMSALINLSSRLSIAGPLALADRLSGLNCNDARVLLDCVLIVPGCPSKSPIVSMSDKHIQALLPDICHLFEQAFSKLPS